eukprot:1806874-Amphidinium_carterae.5
MLLQTNALVPQIDQKTPPRRTKGNHDPPRPGHDGDRDGGDDRRSAKDGDSWKPVPDPPGLPAEWRRDPRDRPHRPSPGGGDPPPDDWGTGPTGVPTVLMVCAESLSPAKIRQSFEEWAVGTGLRVSMWFGKAIDYWEDVLLMKTTSSSRDAFLMVKRDTFSTYDGEHPEVRSPGEHAQILTRLLRKIMPTADHSRMALTKEMQDVNQRLPATLHAEDRWLDDYFAKLAMAHCPVEPSIILTIFNKALEKPMETDKLSRDIWSDHSRLPKVRNPTFMAPVLRFSEVTFKFFGEVRLAIREDRLGKNIESSIHGGQSPQRNPVGAGMEGDTRNDCQKFFSNEGCKYGHRCRDRHPESLGRCFICGVPISVHAAKNCLRGGEDDDEGGDDSDGLDGGRGSRSLSESIAAICFLRSPSKEEAGFGLGGGAPGVSFFGSLTSFKGS